MRKQQKYSDHLDKAGMLISGLCAVHCSLLPVLVVIGMGSGFGWMLSHEVELAFFLSSFAIASYSLLEGYLKNHGRIDILLLAFLGFAMLVIGHEVEALVLSILLSTLGGILVLVAHLINFKLRSRGINFASNR